MMFSSVERFVKAVKTARDYNAKEVRLTIQEAEQLSAHMTEWLLQERELHVKIMQLQDQLLKQSAPVNDAPVQLNGGKF